MTQSSANGSPANDSHALTVLVVEDEFLVRDDIVQNLQDGGCVVVEADSAERAIAMCRSGMPVDVLFTDINLDGRGCGCGWDVAEAFRAARPGIAVVYTSGNSTDHSRCVPGSLFFNKPYCATDVVAACRRLPHSA